MNATPPRALYRVLVIAGGAALLAAMTVDVLALLGRHTGLPLLGSIELVQAAVLLSGACAIVVATLSRAHAVVHLLRERAGPRLRAALDRGNAVLGAGYFLALAFGSGWIARDLWHAHEASELLGIAYRPLRLAVIAAALAVAGILIAQAWTRRR